MPLVIEQLLAVTIGMADTMMVANVGQAAVSGISLVDSLNILLIQIFSALATGGAVVASQYLGRQDRENACGAAKQLVYACAAISILVGGLAMLGGKHLLSLIFGAVEPDVITPKPISGSSALSLSHTGDLQRRRGAVPLLSNSRVSMMTSIAMNLVNISCIILIYVFNMGVAGAEVASLVSPHPGRCRHDGAAATGTTSSLSGISSRYRFDWPMVRSILHIGVPNGLENGMFPRCWISSLIAVFGTSAITANAIANNLAQFECPRLGHGSLQ